MRRSYASALYIIALINCVISIIVAFIIILSTNVTSFGFIIIFIPTLIGIILLTLLCLTIANIEDATLANEENTSAILRIYKDLQDKKNGVSENTTVVSAHNPNSINTGDGWRCLKCRSINPSTKIYCSCGAYK